MSAVLVVYYLNVPQKFNKKDDISHITKSQLALTLYSIITLKETFLKPKNKIPDIVFYQNLGELFYAIAAADKVVKTEEYKTLIEMIVSDWKIYDTINEFYNEADGYQIENIFNLLNYKKLDAQICFNNFREYARTHSAYFSKEKIELIYKTAHAIASSFSSKNKSELIMLANLELLFNEPIFNN